MKLHRSLWRGAALALLFLLLTTSIGFSQSEPPVELQAETEAELQAVPSGWKIETVDDGRIFGELGQHSLAYGPGGVPHVAYGADHLYHASRPAGEWVIELVDSAPQVGKEASMAVDSLGNVYISYYDELNQDLKYATNWKGWWEVTTLASTGNVGGPSFVFSIWGDQAPNVYVGYLNATTHKVMLMYSEEEMLGNWSEPEIISGNLNVSNFAMTMRGYQAYVSLASGGDIYYATSTDWSAIEMVGEGQSITAIAVTDDGTPYIPISFYDSYWGWITYLAYKENGIWVSPTDDNQSNLLFSLGDPKPEALSIRAAGNLVYIAMQLPGTSSYFHDLVIARGAKDIYDAGSFFTVREDAGGELYPAVTIPPNAPSLKAAVVYLSNGTLSYEFLDTSLPETWKNSQSPVDASSDLGKCAVLRVDNAGKAHVLYNRSDNGSLLYKFSTNSGWSASYTVTNTGEWAICSYYSQPGMDLDSTGKPVVSYVNINGELKYAKWYCPPIGRCGFQDEIVDIGLGYEGSAAVIIGKADNPNILYHKDNHLKFAFKPSPGSPTWTFTTIDNSISTYGALSLEADSDGKLHAGFVTLMDYPYYARFGFGGGYWSNITRLEPTDWTMDPISIAIDPVTNNPQIAFTTGKLLVTREYTCPPCDWNFRTTVDTPTDNANGSIAGPSITIDSTGRRFFSYYYKSPAQAQDGLKFMVVDGTTKLPSMVESTIGRVDSTSIALRLGNVPVIAYHVPALGQIKVAWGPYSVFLPLVKR